jgi:hypothetical protein
LLVWHFSATSIVVRHVARFEQHEMPVATLQRYSVPQYVSV